MATPPESIQSPCVAARMALCRPLPRSLRTLVSLAGGLIGLLLAGCGDADPPAPDFVFVDVSAAAGVTLRNVCGDPRRWYIPESNGCGAAWLDADGDGDMDLFVANSGRFIYHEDGRRLEVDAAGESRLYRNDGAWRFTDASEAAGLLRRDWVNAVAVGDVDSDGDPDLYLACLGPDVLLINEGGTFRDATAASGLGNLLWGASAAFGDADGDGDLDLYVANYCEFDPNQPPLDGRRNVIDGVEVGWGPEEENKQGANPGAPDVYYRNDGRGRFEEATAAAGLRLDKALCSYAVVFSDVDGDGWQDLLVANDLQPCNLFINQRDGTFREEGVTRGFAYDARGGPTGAMGLCTEDFDQDGDLDVFRTNFDFEANSLHRNDGAGRFIDVAGELGLAEPSLDRLGWGCAWFDADLDGDLDLLVANGHVYPQAAQIGMSPWLQLSQLFEARADASGRLHYEDVTAATGGALSLPRSARGLALADADDDGDIDAVLVDVDEPVRLLENRSKRRGEWLSVRLVGRVSNRDGLGAWVTVRAGGRSQLREMKRTQGLYSSHDPRLHFGLGPVSRVESIHVRWPSGRESHVQDPPLRTVIELIEPDAPPPGAESRAAGKEAR